MNKSKLTHSVLQHPTDLVFAVVDTSVLHLLTVLKTQTVTIGDYTIQFAIIGESHTIQADFWTDCDELCLNFPEMFGQIPFTKIQWMTSDTNIQWRTIHVYPLQTHTTYVYTDTYFDLTGRNNHERINGINA